METSKMSALQKLVRAAEIGMRLCDVDPKSAIHQELLCERAALFAGVHFPPADLIGNPDPQAWAHGMARYFFEISPEACYAWLSNAMLAGAQAAQQPSFEAGRTEGMRVATEGLKEMADALGFIRAGADAGRIKCPMLADPNATVGQGGDAMSLSAYITRTLTDAGLE